jgi:photosystem II stability/assembly factor-like uncharacterized protein
LKKIFLILLLLFIYSAYNNASAQGWIVQASGVNATLRMVVFYNGATGWSVGYNGTIIKTTNSGITWTPQVSGTTDDLFSIAFADPDNLMACGEGGTILKTTNGGAQWTALSSGTNVTLRAIDCPVGTPLQFRACGDLGVIRITTNGGATWSAETSNTTRGINSIYFLGALTGWAAGDSGTVLGSGSGGWGAPDTTFPARNENLTSITPSRYMCSNKGNFFKFVRGWLTIPVAPGTALYSLTQAGNNPKFLWTSGANGTVKYSTDFGGTWSTQNTFTASTIYSVYMIDSLRGWLVGENGFIAGTVTGGTVGVQQIGTSVPDEFTLHQNYPNPFNPSTNFEFAIARSGFVILKVYTIQGKEIRTLVSNNLHAGVYTAKFDADGLPGGVYFYTLQTEGVTQTKKMLLVK